MTTATGPRRDQTAPAVALQPARKGRWLPRVPDWRVRTKLGAVLAIPAIAFLAVAGWYVNTSIRQSTEFGNFAKEITVGRDITTLIHNLQTERDHAAGLLALPPESAYRSRLLEQLTEDQTAVNTAVTAVADGMAPLRSHQQLYSAYHNATATLGSLASLRDGIRGGWLRQRAVFEQYSRAIADLQAVAPTWFDLSAAPDLADQVRSLRTLSEFAEYGAQLRGRLFAAATSGAFDLDDDQLLAELRAKESTAGTVFRAEAHPRDVARLDSVMSTRTSATATRVQQAAVERVGGRNVGLDPTQWWDLSTARLAQVRGVEQAMRTAVIRSANTLHNTRGLQTATFSGAMILTLTIALLLSWSIGQSMSRALLALRTQALDVANHRLPLAIEELRRTPTATPTVEIPTSAVRSADEIGEVSAAFTAIHRSAVRLATEQAAMRNTVNAMFVNLARRSQSLVERQLRLLDELEATQTDPDQLDSLFQLDHLATRMRRNDENLLILAGSEAIRRRTEPVDLSAIVLAAIAEIEQYVRVRRDVPLAVRVVSHAASDLAHLLAELLENATVFSPPDTTVTVSAHAGGGSGGGGATIVVVDAGIGMTPSGLADANARVGGTAPIDVDISERMGLVVVGHIAARHGITVRLDATDPGVTAVISIPPALVRPAATTPQPSDVRGCRCPRGWSRQQRWIAVCGGPGRPADPQPPPGPAPPTHPAHRSSRAPATPGCPSGRPTPSPPGPPWIRHGQILIRHRPVRP